MNLIQSIIISVVEGLTEFLPISSTGHLILTADLMQIFQSDFVKSFEIFIQLGAIMAIIFLYWKRLVIDINIWKKIIVAFIPTAIVGFSLYKLIKYYLLDNTQVVLISLFLGGIALIILESKYNKKNADVKTVKELTYKKAFIIGMFQSVSIIPGISRSAATIFGGLLLGLERELAVEFSFFLAIPTMVAATGLDMVKSKFSYSEYQYLLLVLGFTVAFVTALLAVKYFLNFIKKHSFIPFGVYRIILALVFWFVVLK
ncbi:undecaprenyl-diphosphatase [Candidatus Gottesmanbacteria bacterium CG11_big_fil_rev_8_21_14_0_20_37_11]|uniref:Undecaprenyl-diphosphatase n=1 Tax=Candidatus Gottesmanbacteria bacterium CG11_big_fil_rev_8_21_14_0_20_37_11 TaxID=1974575 RepID=A0A2H0NK43_9BACT|nr:MAG: undecaprenyl-diphosphatase [Candidatus Gottesmanbacteria bacterium CG11_big_fil_rev_8_21_14_0_20_37_11]